MDVHEVKLSVKLHENIDDQSTNRIPCAARCNSLLAKLFSRVREQVQKVHDEIMESVHAVAIILARR